MTEVLLDGYRPIKKRWPVYSLDENSGEVATQWFESQREGAEVGLQSGVGDYREIGRFFSKKKGFFALYASEETLFIWLNGRRFDALREDVVARRDVDFLLRKRFRVYVKGESVFECRYSYLDYEDFPDKDIFWYIARNLATPERRLRKFLMLLDKASGSYRPTGEYVKELKHRVNEMLTAK